MQRWRDETREEIGNLKKNQKEIHDTIEKIHKSTDGEDSEKKRTKQRTQLKAIWKEGASNAALQVSKENKQRGKPPSILAFLFGIAPPDFQSGDIGSKAIHPSSRFHTCNFRTPTRMSLAVGNCGRYFRLDDIRK